MHCELHNTDGIRKITYIRFWLQIQNFLEHINCCFSMEQIYTGSSGWHVDMRSWELNLQL